jgi:hypothetical protein
LSMIAFAWGWWPWSQWQFGLRALCLGTQMKFILVNSIANSKPPDLASKADHQE